MAYVNQPFVGKLVEEGHQIALTLLDLDIEGAGYGVANFDNLARVFEGDPKSSKQAPGRSRHPELDPE